MSGVNGIINLIKPPGMTSFQAANWLKKYLNAAKAGHTGTLDPAAAGVLPVCLGRATKVIPYLNDETKSYLGELTLGTVTDTLDAEGRIIEKNEGWRDLSREVIEETFEEFRGEIEQLPPMYSAVHHQGKRLYEIAREGRKVEREARRVLITKLEIIRIDLPVVHFAVTCSRGTYIRSLAADMGKRLGCGGHLSFLIRTRSGVFSLEDGVTLEETVGKGLDYLLPLDYPLDFRAVKIKKAAEKKVRNGAVLNDRDLLPQEVQLNPEELVSIYSSRGVFYAIYQASSFPGEGIRLRSVRVFNN